MNKKILLLMALAAVSLSLPAQKNNGIVARGAKPVLLAGHFGFTEGPATDKAGNVYFTDQNNDKIYIWTTGGC